MGRLAFALLIAIAFSATADPSLFAADAADNSSPSTPIPVKPVETVPVGPAPMPATLGQFVKLLSGTWIVGGNTLVFSADGTMSAKGGSVINGTVVTTTGTYRVAAKGEKAFLLHYTVHFRGGTVSDVTQSDDVPLEVVDADTFRDTRNGSTWTRKSGADPAAATPAAAAPCSGKVLLRDTFEAIDGSNSAVSVENGKLKIKQKADYNLKFRYPDVKLVDGDICVVAQIPNRFEVAAGVIGGVMFWSQDSDNFYAFEMSPTGNAVVLRNARGHLSKVVDWKKAEGLKPQPGAKNRIRIVLDGGVATTFLNGVRFDSSKLEAPPGGGSVGFFVLSESARPDAWKFGDLMVTTLSK